MEVSSSSSQQPVYDFAAALGYDYADRLPLDYDPYTNMAVYADNNRRTFTHPEHVLDRRASHRDGSMPDAMRDSGLHPGATHEDIPYRL